jgi:hypothetical protein
VEVRGEKYRNFWDEMPCSGLKHCPEGLEETATWRQWRICGPVLRRHPSFTVLGEDQDYKPQDNNARLIENPFINERRMALTFVFITEENQEKPQDLREQLAWSLCLLN